MDTGAALPAFTPPSPRSSSLRGWVALTSWSLSGKTHSPPCWRERWRNGPIRTKLRALVQWPEKWYSLPLWMWKVKHGVLIAIGSHFVIMRKADLKTKLTHEGQQSTEDHKEMEPDSLETWINKTPFYHSSQLELAFLTLASRTCNWHTWTCWFMSLFSILEVNNLIL